MVGVSPFICEELEQNERINSMEKNCDEFYKNIEELESLIEELEPHISEVEYPKER